MTNYVPISTELHRNKRWVRQSSLAFAKTDTVAPLYVNELAAAMHAMPIAFIKQEHSFSMVVVMGLHPKQNAFVSADGRWTSDYLPVTYRSSPFELFSIGNESEQVLCIDESCITEETVGEPFFREDGEIAKTISEVFEVVKRLNVSRHLTQTICASLAECNLIHPWEIILEDGSQKQAVNGLYKIDETILNNLSEDVFFELRNVGALTAIYAQLFSMHKLSSLAEVIRQSAPAPKAEIVMSDTFDFGGLN